VSIEYFERIKDRMPHFFIGVDVLEYVPHSRCKAIAHLFEDSRYVVVDALHHDLSDVPDGLCTVTMSVDFFHRAPNYLEMFEEMHRVSSKLVMFSCAAAGTKPNAAGYWKNLTEADFSTVLNLDEMFDSYEFQVNLEETQLSFWGVKRSEI